MIACIITLRYCSPLTFNFVALLRETFKVELIKLMWWFMSPLIG